MPQTRASLRARLHAQLDPSGRPRGLSPVNLFLAVAILVSVAFALIETEVTIAAGREHLFRIAELSFAAIFSVEYAARFWTAAERGGWQARLRWVISPGAVIDLLAILPALLTVGVAPTYLLRLARLLRILRLAKLGRFSSAWDLAREAVMSRRYELLLAFYAAVLVMIVSGTLLYLVEGPTQPEKFGSIPTSP